MWFIICLMNAKSLLNLKSKFVYYQEFCEKVYYLLFPSIGRVCMGCNTFDNQVDFQTDSKTLFFSGKNSERIK